MDTSNCSQTLTQSHSQKEPYSITPQKDSLYNKPRVRKIQRRSYRYELDPNNRQRTLLNKHAGCARFAYNWGLEQRIQRFLSHTGKARFISAFDQHRQLNRLKQTCFPWMYECPSVLHRKLSVI